MNEVLDQLSEINPDAIVWNGLDDAIIGIANSFGKEPVLAYSHKKIIDILMKRDNATYEEAEEFYEFNIIGMYAGKHNPIIIEELCE